MLQPKRQGDILFLPVEEMPPKSKKFERINGKIVIAEGEVTGHAHVIDDPNHQTEMVSITSTADAVDRWLRVGSQGAVVTHDEHAPIELEPGFWRVIRQKEYNPLEDVYVLD